MRRHSRQGATVVDTAERVWRGADLVFKVKEPQPHEIAWLRPGQLLFAYLHLAPDEAQTKALLTSGATWEESRECRPRASSCSAAGSWAPTPPSSPPAWAPT